MTPQKTGLRRSRRTSAVNWKPGDTRALFRAPGRHAPEEIAATQKKAAEERKSKEQVMKAKAKKAVRDLNHASELEDALVKQREEIEDALPRRCTDVKTENGSDPDEKSPTQKASRQTGLSKQADARRQTQPNHGQFVADIDTPAKPVRGPTSCKTQADNKGIERGAGVPQVASAPNLRAALKRKRKDIEKDSGAGGEEFKDPSPFDQRHRKRLLQSICFLNEPGQSENEDIPSISGEEELMLRPKRIAIKTQVINDGISELAGTDGPNWKLEMSLGNNHANEDDGLDSMDWGTMYSEDNSEDGSLGVDAGDSNPEESPRQKKNKANMSKSSKPKNADKGKGRRRNPLVVVEPSQPTRLTEGALFLLNLCNDYKDYLRARAKFGVSKAWILQNKNVTAAQRERLFTENSDNDPTALEAAASKPIKKCIVDSGVTISSHARTVPSKRSRKASTLEKVRYKEPMTSCRYGGLEDEDDTEEWEAIKQRPIKEPGVRISDHAVVKVVESRVETYYWNGVE